MSGAFSESINTVYALASQIDALIELMMMCEESVDIKAIKTASEMCQTMHTDMMREVESIERYCMELEMINKELEFKYESNDCIKPNDQQEIEKLPGDYIEEMVKRQEAKSNMNNKEPIGIAMPPIDDEIKCTY